MNSKPLIIIDAIICFFNRCLQLVFEVCLCGCLIISGYHLYLNQVTINAASQTQFHDYHPDDGSQPLSTLSKEAIGWLTIHHTRIDYAVMQSDNNTRYLNTLPDGSFGLSGSLFLDYRNNRHFTDNYEVIYGHHMAHGAMFGSLDDYYKEEYFNTHCKGTLILKDGTRFQVHVFALIKAYANNPLYYEMDDSRFAQLKAAIKKEAIYYRECHPHHIVGLSTCARHASLERTILMTSISRQTTNVETN